mmetsp:Transcript_38066/g.94441  ORF Transcript_38066/g.94441 Transcript_38066/m.94441 type:complete len:223 (-) Transcript_38066:510-1178(-)
MRTCSMARVALGSVLMSHTGRETIVLAAAALSPSRSRCAAAITCSRKCSAGAAKTRRSYESIRRRSALLIVLRRRFGSARCAQSRGSSSSSVPTRKQASTNSSEMCMWKGTCRLRSSFSCSGLRSLKRALERPCANNSRCRLAPTISPSAATASAKCPCWKAAMPTRTRARLYRICVLMSEKPMLSCRWLMSSMSRATWKRSCRAWWKVWHSSARVFERSSA